MFELASTVTPGTPPLSPCSSTVYCALPPVVWLKYKLTALTPALRAVNLTEP